MWGTDAPNPNSDLPWRARQLGYGIIGAGMMGADIFQILPTKGAWLVFPAGKTLTTGERAMISIGGLLGQLVGRDPDAHVPSLFQKIGISGLVGPEPPCQDVRNIQIAGELLGPQALWIIGCVAAGVLDAAYEKRFMAIPDDEAGNIAPEIRFLLSHVRIDIDVGHLMKDVEARAARTTRH